MGRCGILPFLTNFNMKGFAEEMKTLCVYGSPVCPFIYCLDHFFCMFP